MDGTPGIVAGSIGAVGAAVVAWIQQRGAGAAEKAAATVAKYEERLVAVEAALKDLPQIRAALTDLVALRSAVDEARRYVDTQIGNARREWDRARRTGSQPAIAIVDDVREAKDRADEAARAAEELERRVTAIETERRDERTAELERQREMGGLLAKIEMLLRSKE